MAKKPDTSFAFGANVRTKKAKGGKKSGGKSKKGGNAWAAYVGGGK
jgi:hypothetical protein